MEVKLTIKAKQDLEFWKKTNNKKILKRIRELTAAILAQPYVGIGKPEALKHQLSGKWSRRVTQTDRIVYQIQGEILFIFSLKGHYDNL